MKADLLLAQLTRACSCQNPVALAENHPAGRKNRENESVLPNGQVRVVS